MAVQTKVAKTPAVKIAIHHKFYKLLGNSMALFSVNGHPIGFLRAPCQEIKTIISALKKGVDENTVIEVTEEETQG